MRTVALCVVGLLSLTACGEGLAAGDTKIKPGVYGIWEAPNATADCKWNVRTKKGVVLRSGKGSRTASVVLGKPDYDRVFSANAACGSWVKSK
jgi:hypothetical protein